MNRPQVGLAGDVGSSPEGYPQDLPYSWWRLHDEYDGLKPDA